MGKIYHWTPLEKEHWISSKQQKRFEKDVREEPFTLSSEQATNTRQKASATRHVQTAVQRQQQNTTVKLPIRMKPNIKEWEHWLQTLGETAANRFNNKSGQER